MSFKNPFPADRFFTNRENHFVSFQKAISNLTDKNYSVLTFYGVGGIGKTRLKKELVKKALESEDLIISKSLDFHQTEYRDQSIALHMLCRDLKSQKIMFPTFELAYALYWQKTHPEQHLSKSNIPYLDEGGIVFDIVSIMKDVPLVGLIPKIGIILLNAKKGWDDWWTKIGQRELSKLEDMDAHQILSTLPYFFAVDLRAAMEQSAKKLVFFIDTYESLWTNQDDRKIEKFFEKDKWVRDLIGYLPNTLWVILGREKLRWEELDEDIIWDKYLDQHLLGELSHKDANKFLEHCEIVEEDIREHIIKASKGLPFYLDLQVDTYLKILARGEKPSIEMFGKNSNDILVRFIKYLSPSEIETLKTLSCSKYWTYEIFELMVEDFKTGFSLTAFEELIGFSFITPTKLSDGTQAFTIHQIMRGHLKKILNVEIRKKIHRSLYNYYYGLLDVESGLIELNTRVLYLLEESIYNYRKFEVDITFYSWLLKLSQKLYGYVSSDTIQRSLSKAFDELVFDDHYLIVLEISIELSRLNHWTNNIELEHQYAEKGLELVNKIIADKYFQENMAIEKEPDLLECKMSLLVRKAEVLYTLDQNIAAFELFREARTLGSKINISPNLRTYSRLLRELGRLPEAEGYFYNELRGSVRDNDTDLMALNYWEIAKLFRIQKCHTAETRYAKKALELYEQKRGKEHPFCWIVRVGVADGLLGMQKYNQAKSILEEALSWSIKEYGEQYIDNGYIYLEIARCNLGLKEYAEALTSIDKCIILLSPKFGKRNVEVMAAKALFCQLIQSTLLTGTFDGSLGDETAEEYVIRYNKHMLSFEEVFYQDFDSYKMNYGYFTFLTDILFHIFEFQFSSVDMSIEKLSLLNLRKAELDRIFDEQFRIRELEGADSVPLNKSEEQVFLKKCNEKLGMLDDADFKINLLQLPYFLNTNIYELNYSGLAKKYILQTEDELEVIDYTSAPIYNITKKQFYLSEQTILNYLIFFFDSVKGRNGKFHLVKNQDDCVPFTLDNGITQEVKDKFLSYIKPYEILTSSPSSVSVKIDMIFQNSLFNAVCEVKSDGMVSMSDEKLVFEDGPVRVEPYIMLKDKSSDEVIERTFHAIEEYLVNAEVDEIDRGMTQIMFERIASYRKGDQESKTDEKLHLILDDAVFLIDKYVKGTYQNNLVFAKDVGDLLQEMKSVLENSALIKWRMAINLNLQSIFEYSSKQETDNDLTAKLRIHSELDEEPIKVEFCRPSFFAKSVLYQLWYNSGRRKYILELENSYHLLDATNRPIYTVSDKDFVLSTDTVKDYVDFFFRAVIGKNGGFLIFTQEMEIPYKRDIDIDENIHKNILEHIQPIEIIESSEEQIAMVANIFFRDALFKSNIVVNKDGTCSLNNEELVLENLPIDTKGFV